MLTEIAWALVFVSLPAVAVLFGLFVWAVVKGATARIDDFTGDVMGDGGRRLD